MYDCSVLFENLLILSDVDRRLATKWWNFDFFFLYFSVCFYKQFNNKMDITSLTVGGLTYYLMAIEKTSSLMKQVTRNKLELVALKLGFEGPRIRLLKQRIQFFSWSLVKWAIFSRFIFLMLPLPAKWNYLSLLRLVSIWPLYKVSPSRL